MYLYGGDLQGWQIGVVVPLHKVYKYARVKYLTRTIHTCNVTYNSLCNVIRMIMMEQYYKFWTCEWLITESKPVTHILISLIYNHQNMCTYFSHEMSVRVSKIQLNFLIFLVKVSKGGNRMVFVSTGKSMSHNTHSCLEKSYCYYWLLDQRYNYNFWT